MRGLAWLLAGTAAAALIAAAPIAAVNRAEPFGAIWYLTVVVVPFLAAGILLLWRHHGHRAGPLLVSAVALVMAYPALLEQVIWSRLPETGPRPWMSLALVGESISSMLGVACLALLIGLFPTGLPRGRWERRFAAAVWFLPVPVLLALASNEHVPTDGVAYAGAGPFPSPLFVAGLDWLAPVTGPLRQLTGLVMVVAVALLLRRYLASEERQRRQIRWVLYGTSVALAIGITPFILTPIIATNPMTHGPSLMVASTALLLIPASVVIAIEQPRWFDTDAVIRHSFGYAVLSFAILVCYVGIAAGLGLAAGTRLPLWTAIGLTVVVAVVFQPARERLQRVADRWVFGPRPTASQALAGLDATLHTNGGTAKLGAELAETVRRAARLRWVEVDLGQQTFESGRRVGDAVLEVQLRNGDEPLGRISCGRPLAGPLTDDRTALVAALANHAALGLANADLARRIVGAQEEERRRLERDIHDGASRS